MAWRRALNAHSLPDGRLSLQDGPIHLVVGVEGTPAGVRAGQAAAGQRLLGLMPALGEEWAMLRQALREPMPSFRHPVAQRMAEACWPHRLEQLSPMTALAGAVAEYVLEGVSMQPGVQAAHVNHGGDIAIHLAGRASLRVGLCGDLASGRPDGLVLLRAGDGVGGVVTSGWAGGRHSRGIADAVTVLAARAADADAAAMMIANAVDAEHPAIIRRPANSLDPDSDLAALPVTVEVRALPKMLVLLALERGARVAERLAGRGLIRAALLRLQGESITVGDVNVTGLPLASNEPALQ
jgi:ApbE superfamily uncharacterized protein (UPF0280 family)